MIIELVNNLPVIFFPLTNQFADVFFYFKYNLQKQKPNVQKL